MESLDLLHEVRLSANTKRNMESIYRSYTLSYLYGKKLQRNRSLFRVLLSKKIAGGGTIKCIV